MKSNKSGIKKLAIVTATTALLMSSVTPALAYDPVETSENGEGCIWRGGEQPFYVTVIEMTDEYGQPVWVSVDCDGAIDKERVRIAEAKEALENETDDSTENEPSDDLEGIEGIEDESDEENDSEKEEISPNQPEENQDDEDTNTNESEDRIENTDEDKETNETNEDNEVAEDNNNNDKKEVTYNTGKEEKVADVTKEEYNSKEISTSTNSKEEKNVESNQSIANSNKNVVSQESINTYKIDSVTKQEQLNFIDSISEDMKTVADEENLYASIMIAQAILATNYGKTYLASEDTNNLMGIKGSYNGASVSLNSPEGKQNYRQYSSVKEGLQDYVDLMNKDLYNDSLQSNSSSVEEAVEVIAKHYAVDEEYADKIMSLINTYDLKEYDK